MGLDYTSIYRCSNSINQNSNLTIFTDELESYLLKAKELAKYVLGDHKKFLPNYYDEGMCGGCFNNSFIFISTDNRSSYDKKSNLLCLAIETILTASAFLGINFAQVLKTKDLIEENNRFRRDYNNILSTIKHPHVKKINKVITFYDHLLLSRIKSKIINCALCISAIAGGIFFAIGTLYSLSALMVIGATLVLVSGAAALFKFFFSYDRENFNDQGTAAQINILWRKLKRTGKNPQINYASVPVALSDEHVKIFEKQGYATVQIQS